MLGEACAPVGFIVVSRPHVWLDTILPVSCWIVRLSLQLFTDYLLTGAMSKAARDVVSMAVSVNLVVDIVC